MQCKGCGNRLPTDAQKLKFCVYCGKPIGRTPGWIKAMPPLATLGLVVIVLVLLWPRSHPKPDLVVDAVTLSTDNLCAGQDVTITVTLRNQGAADAEASAIRCSVDGVTTDWADVGPLAADATIARSFTWTLQTGVHVVEAAADSYSQVTEIDENNNTRQVRVGGPPPPDLVVDNMSWSPSSPSEGEKVTFTVTIRNLGPGGAGSFNIRYGEGSSATSSRDVDFLAAGGTAVQTFEWTAIAGDRTIHVLADGDDSIREGNEANNSREVTLSIAVQQFPVGALPYSIALGDLNSDGVLDIATANKTSSYVSVLLGKGDGSFADQTTFGVGATPVSLAMGDLNGDGILDIATANLEVGSVSVLLGKGDGSFGYPKTFGVGSYPESLAMGDLNGDGILDIATATYWSESVSVLLGNGDGSFGSHAAFHVAANVNNLICLAMGDLNGDGVLDIATGNTASNVYVLLGNGDGSLVCQTNSGVGSRPSGLAMGDLNGDGILDIAAANKFTNNVTVLLGNGDGSFASRASLDVGVNPLSLAIGDLNGDGVLDMATANSNSNNVSVLLGNGDGSFASQTTFDVGLNPFSLAMGDVNGDGILDIVTANSGGNNVSVRLGNGDGTFAT